MKIYRAAKDDYVTVGSCFAISSDDAEAYLDNPGFGGSCLFVAEVEIESVLDLTEKRDDWDGLSEVSGLEIDPEKYGCHFGRIVADDELVDELAKKYDWIIFEDDFPVGCKTIAPLSGAAVEAIEDSIEEI